MKVITYGTFDLFHIGHLRLIRRLCNLGDELIVAVSTDEFNKLKGKKTIIPYEQRKEIVENIKGVDLVIPENSWEQKPNDIKVHNIDTFVIGDDWQGQFDYLSDLCKVVYLKRTKNISSTEIKSTLNKLIQQKDSLFKMFEIVEQLKEDFSN